MCKVKISYDGLTAVYGIMSVLLMIMPGRVTCSDLSNKLVQLLSVLAHLEYKCINHFKVRKLVLRSAPCEGLNSRKENLAREILGDVNGSSFQQL